MDANWKNTLKRTAWILLSLLVLVVDQVTKVWASSQLVYAEPLSLMPFLNFTLLHNTGVAFSLLHGVPAWVFIAIGVAVCLLLIGWLWQLSARGSSISLLGVLLILGGALGNIIDRVRLGYVVDFIDVYYRHWHWPAFNVADAAICVGVALLLLDEFLRYRAHAIEQKNSAL